MTTTPPTRYTLTSHGQYSMRYESLDEDPDGDWVAWSAFDDLSRQLGERTKEWAAVTADCARYHGMFEGTTHLLAIAERAQAVIDAANAKNAAPIADVETCAAIYRLADSLAGVEGQSDE